MTIISRDGARIFRIGYDKKWLNGLITLPLFLRFNNVDLLITNDQLPIEKTFELIERHLLSLKPTLNDTNILEIRASYNVEFCFSDNALLECIRNRFLPICNSSRAYKFHIDFVCYKNTATNVIASILQMNEIKRCLTVEFHCSLWQNQPLAEKLAVEEIANWLKRSTDGIENIVQSRKERSLTIYFNGFDREHNVRELLENLKTVFNFI